MAGKKLPKRLAVAFLNGECEFTVDRPATLSHAWSCVVQSVDPLDNETRRQLKTHGWDVAIYELVK